MREVDGLKIAFVSSESYFEGFHTPSMVSTQKATGADMVLLLSPGKVESDITDDMIRALLSPPLEIEEEERYD
ncbi:MAG TPA: hypothetical protein VEY92_08665 [Pseudoxanthomonas sp.]|nr:hypothetical protein [Pseudoxanthomonas sp.]